MSLLSTLVLDHLSRIGIVDTSTCKRCEKRNAEYVQNDAANRQQQRSWDDGDDNPYSQSLVIHRDDNNDIIVNGADTPIASSTMPLPSLPAVKPRDRHRHAPPTPLPSLPDVRTMHGSLAMLAISEADANKMMTPPTGKHRIRRADGKGAGSSSALSSLPCDRCNGTGHDLNLSHYGYAEDVEMHTLAMTSSILADPSDSDASADSSAISSSSSPYAFSPQSSSLKSLLLHERGLVSLLLRAKDVERKSRVNTMMTSSGSTPPPRKRPSAGAPGSAAASGSGGSGHKGLRITPATSSVALPPTSLPRRDATWLWAQFQELKFAPPRSSSSASSSSARSSASPPLAELDPVFRQFTSLHTLHVSGHNLVVLENLPKSIKVVHACGNRIVTAILDEPRRDEAAERERAAREFGPKFIVMGGGGEEKEKDGGAKSGSSVTSPKRITSHRTASVLSPHATLLISAHNAALAAASLCVLAAPPLISSYPHLLHLGLGSNRLRDLSAILVVASTLTSLDVSWNEIDSLAQTCDEISEFVKLSSLHLEGNPIALGKFYRAAILDACSASGSGGSGSGSGKLALLDGHAINTHLLNLPTSGGEVAQVSIDASGASSLSSTSRAGVGGGGGGADRGSMSPSAAAAGAFSYSSSSESKDNASDAGGSGSGSNRTSSGRKSLTNARNSGGGISYGAKSLGGAGGKGKPDPVAMDELDRARQSIVASAAAAADVLESAAFHPSAEDFAERTRLLVVMEGGIRGIANPWDAFVREYKPIVVEEVTKKKGGGDKKAALAPAATPAVAATDKSASSTGATGTRKKGSAVAASGSTSELLSRPGSSLDNLVPSAPVDPDLGWFISSHTTDSVSSDGGETNVVVRTTVKKRVKYYVEYRLRTSEEEHEPDDDEDADEERSREDPDTKSAAAVNHQDGNTASARSNASCAINAGNARGRRSELYRTIEYDYEHLTSNLSLSLPSSLLSPPPPPSTSVAICCGSASSPSAQSPLALAYAKELCFVPNRHWRDLVATSGLELLLYTKEVTNRCTETTTTTMGRMDEGGVAQSSSAAVAQAAAAQAAQAQAQAQAAAAQAAAQAAAADGARSNAGSPMVSRRSSTSNKIDLAKHAASSASASAEVHEPAPTHVAAPVSSRGGAGGGKRAPVATKGLAGAKSKKSALGELVTTSSQMVASTDISEQHILLGLAHIDLNQLLAAQPRKQFTTCVIASKDLEFRRAPGMKSNPLAATVAPSSSSSSSSAMPASPLGLEPRSVDPLQWNPQAERRLAVELPRIARGVASALARAEENGLIVSMPALTQPLKGAKKHVSGEADKPHRASLSASPPPTSVANSVAIAAVASPPAKASRGAVAASVIASPVAVIDNKDRAIDRDHRSSLTSSPSSSVDNVYTLGSCTVFLNCRPSFGPGSSAFKRSPPPPTHEQQAAINAIALAAANANSKNRRGGGQQQTQQPTATTNAKDKREKTGPTTVNAQSKPNTPQLDAE